jgi:hypothetical protein
MACPHGVGVFAIRPIPAGMRLFKGDTGSTLRVPKAIVDRIVEPALRKMYYDFCPTLENSFIAPTDFNRLTMEWYMNHSTDPNVMADPNLRFSASRFISVGEELTTDYRTFSHSADLISEWTSSAKK